MAGNIPDDGDIAIRKLGAETFNPALSTFPKGGGQGLVDGECGRKLEERLGHMAHQGHLLLKVVLEQEGLDALEGC